MVAPGQAEPTGRDVGRRRIGGCGVPSRQRGPASIKGAGGRNVTPDGAVRQVPPMLKCVCHTRDTTVIKFDDTWAASSSGWDQAPSGNSYRTIIVPPAFLTSMSGSVFLKSASAHRTPDESLQFED